MIRLDYLVLGYKRARADEGSRERIMNLYIKHGRTVEMSPEGEFLIPLFSSKKYERMLAGVPCQVSEPRGFLGFIVRNRHRVGIIGAIFVCLFLYLLTANMVWDIRIETDGELSAEVVEKELKNVGFGVGSIFVGDLTETEQRVLAESDTVSFININRRGTVAYVNAIGKSHGASPDDDEPCNIVALYDCVIEEISVKSGIALVKAGQTVRRGEVIISGVIPEELGGGSVHADGRVVGRVYRTDTVNIARKQSVKEFVTNTPYACYLNIFGFSINIFKNYRNYEGKYDIISNEERITLKEGVRLPLGITRSYISQYTESQVEYDDSELVRLAGEKLSEIRKELSSLGEAVRMTSRGELTDYGYTASLDTVYLTEVGGAYPINQK